MQGLRKLALVSLPKNATSRSYRLSTAVWTSLQLLHGTHFEEWEVWRDLLNTLSDCSYTAAIVLKECSTPRRRCWRL
ncbi:hypothetical protein Y032_0098g3123 [Ancylostoma ceylanicum]|uniref:Uncharacterized protein n=1 Tax=Ancylostoma ceylanicum TaxID=53326 RepID=A0A016TJN2_9BILA|nr:hypothetical protein Y032_0098g3123 [Ancylostoma ceylanicum]